MPDPPEPTTSIWSASWTRRPIAFSARRLVDPGDIGELADLLSCVAHHDGRPLQLLDGEGTTLDPSVALAASEPGCRLSSDSEEHAKLRWVMAGLTAAITALSTTLDGTDRLNYRTVDAILDMIDRGFDL